MNELLTIAGGVVAVYSVLALIVSQIVEWINTALNLRGRLLYWGIEEMLSARKPNASSVGIQLAKEIYNHPLISTLGMKDKPSYIGPRTFTVSMIAALRKLDDRPNEKAPEPPNMSAGGEALLADLRARITAVLPACDPLRDSLGLIIEQTENDYESVLKALDAWFEAQMDRVTGTFKRYAAYVQIGLAFLVVYGLHVDTFALITTFSKSAAAQSAISAAQAAQQNADVANVVKILLDDAVISPNWTFPWLPKSGYEFVGVALTWFAVLLGAPFWFDVLKQIVPVRLSGSKPDAAASEKGDKQAIVPRLREGTMTADTSS